MQRLVNIGRPSTNDGRCDDGPGSSWGPESEHIAALLQTKCGTLSSTRASIQAFK